MMEVENYVNSRRESVLNGLKCSHATIYKNQSIFKFLPGHRVLILSWSAEIPPEKDLNEAEKMFSTKHPAFSSILREIISSALTNHNRDPKTRTFSDILMKFAIYIYILAGKASYEIICSNLHLPKVGTIRKFLISRFKLINENVYKNTQ